MAGVLATVGGGGLGTPNFDGKSSEEAETSGGCVNASGVASTTDTEGGIGSRGIERVKGEEETKSPSEEAGLSYCIPSSSCGEGRLSTPVPVTLDPLVDSLVKVDIAPSEIQRCASKGLFRSLSIEGESLGDNES